jgi:cytochrome P450
MMKLRFVPRPDWSESMSTLVMPGGSLRQIADLPAPGGSLPLVGHLHKMLPPSTHLQLERWARELGTPYRVRMGPATAVVYDDPDVAQAVLRDRPGQVRRLATIRPVFREMGLDGLFSAERDDWEPQRRLIMQALNASHFRAFYPALRSITERLLKRWQGAAARGEVLQMNQELMRYTVDVTSTLAFGEDPNTLEQDGNVVQDHLAAIFPMLMQRTLAPWPYWRWVKLPADRRLDRALKAVHAYAHERIARARERLRDDPSSTPRNALEAMLQQADQPSSGFDDNLVVANVLTLLLAGEDTTAYSLSWTLLFLAADKGLQDRMHAQAVDLLGPHGVCAEHDSVKRLDAFEALAMEALRLKPVVSFLGLDTREAQVIGGVALPERSRLILLFRPAQTDERQFACPHTYDASRWAHHEAKGAHNPRAFLQFGAGPRVCPGRHLAAVEMRLVLSMLLKHFEVQLACDPAEIEEHIQFTTLPSRMPVRLVPR